MKSLIPQKQNIVGLKNELQKLEYAILNNVPVLLMGETGLGKTALVRHLAHSRKQPLRRVNLNGQTTVDDFVGKILLNEKGTYWQDGVLIEAMKKGYWLVLDEVNAALPEILFVLHSLLDDDRYVVLPEKDGEIVRPHANFRIFATMNPSGKYTGTKELNKAFLSRFPLILQMEFPDPKDEQEILKGHSTLDEKQLYSLVKMANDLRVSYKKGELDYVCSTRDLIHCVILAKTFGLREALTLTIISRATDADIKTVKTMVNLWFGKTGEAKAQDETKQMKAENVRLKASLAEMTMTIVEDTKEGISRWEAAKGSTEERGALIRLEGSHRLVHTLKDVEFAESENKIKLEKLIHEVDDKLHEIVKEAISRLRAGGIVLTSTLTPTPPSTASTLPSSPKFGKY